MGSAVVGQPKSEIVHFSKISEILRILSFFCWFFALLLVSRPFWAFWDILRDKQSSCWYPRSLYPLMTTIFHNKTSISTWSWHYDMSVESLWESGKFHEFRELTWIYAMAWVLRLQKKINTEHTFSNQKITSHNSFIVTFLADGRWLGIVISHGDHTRQHRSTNNHNICIVPLILYNQYWFVAISVVQ